MIRYQEKNGEPELKYKPKRYPITEAVAETGKIDWTILAGVAEFLLNTGTSRYYGSDLYHCGNPKCTSTFFQSCLVCPKCGEEIDWEGITVRRIKICPKCSLQFSKEINYCPYHVPKIQLVEKDIPI